MRRRGTGVSLACAMTLCAVAARGAGHGVQEVDAAWMKAMKANDIDAVVACYAPDAVMWFPEAPEARGTKAIREIYAGYFDAYTLTDVTLPSASYESSGDLSAGWGNYVMTLQPKKGGDPVVLKGRFTGVAKRSGGKWWYVSDHASPDPAPAPPK